MVRKNLWRRAGGGWPRLALALLLVLGALVALPVAPARAATTFTVTTGADSGTGSLRAAIAAAANGDTITFATGVRLVSISGSELSFSRNITIQGTGTGGVRVERSAGTGRIFTSYGSNATIGGLTIAKGSISTTGGGLLNLGGMTLNNSIVTGNTGNTGGGIYNQGTLNIYNSTIGGNTVDALGGGIDNQGTLTLTNSTISGNTAAVGGGLYNQGTATLTNSTVSGNNSTSTSYIGGGGIYVYYQNSLTLNSSTVSGNTAERGGGIYSEGSTTLTNSTVAGNTARYIAGGLYILVTATLTNVTITGNHNANQAGISVGGTSAVTTMKNTVIAGNDGPNCSLNDRRVDNGGNVEDNNSCGFGGATSLSNALAPVGPLGNYGGTTQTAPLLPGNAAIDRASGCPTTDQRGITRPQGAGCDSGAFESRGFTLSGGSGTGQSSPVRATFGAPLVVTVRSNSSDPVQGGVVSFTGPGSGAGLQSSPTQATIGANGQASAAVVANDTAGGPYTVTAGARGVSGSATFSLTNSTASSTLVVDPASGPYGGTATFSAVLTGGGAPLSGRTVTFTRNGTTVASIPTDLSGRATLSWVDLTGVDGGTYPTGVRATFAGDAGFSGSSGTAALTVTKTSQTITFAQPTDRAATDAPFTVAATASSGLAVTFTASGVCTVAGNTVTLSGAAGNCTIVAHQAGNGQWAAAPDVSRTVVVGKASQAITFAQPPSKTFGAAPFTVTATASSGLAVTFGTTTPAVCTVGTPTTAASATVTISAIGDCTITADQPGNATYAAAPRISRTVAIGQAAQTITFGTPTGTPTYALNDTFVVGAIATSGLAVTFTASGVCTSAGTTVTATGVGTCTVTASQGGNANYNAAPQVVRTFTITKRAQTITFDTPAGDPGYTINQTFAVAATATSGLSVSFAAAPVDVCAIAGTTVVGTGAGICTVTASQAGDDTYGAATPVARTFTITTPSSTPTPTPTSTATPTPTSTPTPTPTSTSTPIPTPITPALTPTPSSTPVPTPTPSGPAPSFADVPVGYWAHDQIVAFARRGITTGCDTGLYCPERPVTRAEMAVFLDRTLGSPNPAPPTSPRFTDVPASYWAYAFIDRFATLGITTGCGGTEFCPDRGVTRAEMAAFLIRALGKPQAAPAAPTFADVPATHPQYGYIEALVGLGVTTGCGTNDAGQRLYCPERGVTRAEMAVFITRAFP